MNGIVYANAGGQIDCRRPVIWQQVVGIFYRKESDSLNLGVAGIAFRQAMFCALFLWRMTGGNPNV